MSHHNSKITGTNYTPTVALFLVSVVGIPIVAMVSLPSGDFSFLFAATSSVLGAGLAGMTWWKSSELSMPSIAVD